MLKTFDRRVVPEKALDFVRACQQQVTSCRLAGGATLAGAYFGHRMTGDLDLFCRDREDVRSLASLLPEISAGLEIQGQVVRDAGHLVRARIELTAEDTLEVDFIHESVEEIEPAAVLIEGIATRSLADLRASKLTCILSRSEPRDLVDLYFLDRAGYPPEKDLELAMRKDSGIDPGVLTWLLKQFPIRPMPMMLKPLSEEELEAFRDDLADRLRKRAI